MWFVAKYKNNELKIFKDNLEKILNSHVTFYQPKIRFYKIIKRNKQAKLFEEKLLGNYLFCNCNYLNGNKKIENFKYIKGLQYFLQGNEITQNNIINFINYCKKNEDCLGFLNHSFFLKLVSKKAKFISGPFVGLIFSIISNEKSKLKILLNNIKINLSKKTEYLYIPV